MSTASSYSTTPRPLAIPPARMPTVALSTLPPASTALAKASTAGDQPLSSQTSRKSLSVLARSGASCASIHSRKSSGSEVRTRLSVQPPGLRHSSASWLTGSTDSVGFLPYARGCAATSAPSMSYTATSKAPSPTMSSHRPYAGSVE